MESTVTTTIADRLVNGALRDRGVPFTFHERQSNQAAEAAAGFAGITMGSFELRRSLSAIR
jgi:hypothetical protein